ncbi:lactate dehydrogenase-like 2-hydroxyacid dehydrogenase [Pseudomonas sp. BIGb0408]|uniref:Lactate dehydrogenase-like 2-hydroxyacid dehydrogenase n=1 Tax=Phytopseudomonas flavescens TaxID=29435 RepID=A0A7Z0BS10_9GAMM|nr:MULTISPECIES: 2-hydroxyacid dehydrogenase [Pseudomonas]MCW2290691.1 lactate dehydrogenase-like 2-hydroxyacid dehydrogenase [Pseudomonas sp. BIGb0408]NYH74736.1 lactate dehydrogenase-like 2-hydroxyacid dehydrogenase [Pseudomonas flavescens]
MKPHLLILNPLSEASLARIAERFEVTHAPNPAAREAAISEHADSVQAVLTIGTIGLTGEEIARLPKLGFVGTLGVGYEKVDLEAARARGIAMSNGAGSNADCVADHAMALLLAAIRDVRRLDVACRAGIWRDALPMTDGVCGKRLGILGLGAIGEKLARRAAAFDMPVGYHNRSAKADSPHRYFASALELARWSDCLVVAIPGGASTLHLVNAEVLDALGPQGYLVNVARGSVVDTAALGRALREKRIRAAALDVYESEPLPPSELLDLDNLTITPHVGGNSPQALEQSLTQFLGNIDRHFRGEPLLTPI